MTSVRPVLPAVFTLRAYPRLGSTSNEAKALAEAGAAHGTVVWAAEQTAGRGRLGREWESPVGNLHVSLLLRPQLPLARTPELGFVAALSAAEAVDGLLRRSGAATLKWPNDILLGGAKLGGILCEAQPAGAALRWVVIGIGLNLARAPQVAPYPVTSLAAHGSAVEPATALSVLLAAMAIWLDRWSVHGFDPVRAAWRERALAGGDEHRGSLVGLDIDGALLLSTLAGPRRLADADFSGDLIAIKSKHFNDAEP